ncbi:MAG TPA: hypothetical protein EYP79_02440 [Campylobacterales bacterium]|nr:hypothetical protein [Campylobacterales bacterium]
MIGNSGIVIDNNELTHKKKIKTITKKIECSQKEVVLDSKIINFTIKKDKKCELTYNENAIIEKDKIKADKKLIVRLEVLNIDKIVVNGDYNGIIDSINKKLFLTLKGDGVMVIKNIDNIDIEYSGDLVLDAYTKKLNIKGRGDLILNINKDAKIFDNINGDLILNRR